jgi:hypothetical protein
MADYTLAEATALLAKVNVAIESKISNTRFASFTTGTHEFSHQYTFDTTSLQELLDLRKQLLDIIGSYEIPEPIFRNNACIGVIARKGDL